jgi:hypothetical protein
MIIAWFVPEIFQRLREFRPFAKGAVIGYYLAPAVLLSALLWSKEAPIAFQQLLGVNLSAGGYKSEERGVDKDGIELVSDGPVKLLRVADACKFTEALYGWANSIHWMDDFGDRNKAFLEKSPK